jgi:putative ABC transport system permease protein
VIRTPLPPATVGQAVQKTVLSVDSDQPISRVRSLDEAAAAAVAVERFTTLLASLFAGLSLTLAAVGAFGVVTHVVSARRRELGIRLAVGASNRDIFRLMASESLRVIVPAAMIGAAAAAAAARWMTSILFQVVPADGQTLLAGIAVLIATALAATYLPVRRALRSNPLTSLREG